MLENKPHLCIINFVYEIHSRVGNEASGKPAKVGKKLLRISGENLQDCEMKLQEVLEIIKEYSI